MKSLILRELELQDEKAFFEGMKEWDGEDLVWYTFDWQPGVKYQDMLTRLKKTSQGIELQENFVPASMLYGFVDDEIVGRVSIRHRLNDQLLRRGGHIGYSVAPRFRKQGFASEMVRQALEFCRTLDLEKVLITCADDNIPSWKIIERFGGVLENKVYDEVDDEMIRRYWIML